MKKFLAFIMCAVMVSTVFTGCVSTEPAPVVRDESLLLNANVLTNYLCNSLNGTTVPEDKDFNYLKFVFSCFYYKDQPDFCYYDATPLTDDEQLVIPLDTSKKMIHQVFGIDWDITENVSGFSTDIKDNNLLFTTGFGWGLMGYHPGEYVYSEFSDNQVISHFELFGPDWDDGDIAHKSYGNYKIIFDIITEQNETFLRFVQFEKQ